MSQRTAITRTGFCPRCNESSTHSYVVYANGAKVRVSRSVSCDSCGYREARDRRNIPDDIASMFYQRDGRWKLTLEDILGSEVDATRAVAKIFRLSEVDAQARLGGLPEEPLALNGVKVVIDEAKEFLAARGIVVKVERDS